MVEECKDVADVFPALVERYERQAATEKGNADADVGALVMHEDGNGEKNRGRDSVYVTLADAMRVLGHPFPATFTIPNPDDEWIRISLAQWTRWLSGLDEADE